MDYFLSRRKSSGGRCASGEPKKVYGHADALVPQQSLRSTRKSASDVSNETDGAAMEQQPLCVLKLSWCQP